MKGKMKKVLMVTIGIFILLSVAGCSANPVKKVHQEGIVSIKDIEALSYFMEVHPDYKIILYEEEDVSGNGLKDLVIIFNGNKDKNSMMVIINNGDGNYNLSNDLPAPAENQKIEFKDIDEKVPTEFIISGSKGNNFGLGIFRLREGEIINIFGDMDTCC